MIDKFTDYKTIVFDCDGVILNSNKVKTQAFFDLAETWGTEAQNLLVHYHINNGGISRHIKIAYFLRTILPSLSIKISSVEFDSIYTELVSLYAKLVYEGLCRCEVSPALDSLRDLTSTTRWSIVSGGDQKELNKLFQDRGLSHLFDAGIFGSPDDKQLILQREFASGNFINSSLFIGDSKYDHISATTMSMDFLFLSLWTEFHDWKNYTSKHRITSLPSLLTLVDSLK